MNSSICTTRSEIKNHHSRRKKPSRRYGWSSHLDMSRHAFRSPILPNAVPGPRVINRRTSRSEDMPKLLQRVHGKNSQTACALSSQPPMPWALDPEAAPATSTRTARQCCCQWQRTGPLLPTTLRSKRRS